MYASDVSALPSVRAFLLEMQRDLARRRSVIMDGRDIGTVVSAGRRGEIYLTASAEVARAGAGVSEPLSGTPKAYDEVLREINERDYNDMHRADIARCARQRMQWSSTRPRLISTRDDVSC